MMAEKAWSSYSPFQVKGLCTERFSVEAQASMLEGAHRSMLEHQGMYERVYAMLDLKESGAVGATLTPPTTADSSPPTEMAHQDHLVIALTTVDTPSPGFIPSYPLSCSFAIHHS